MRRCVASSMFCGGALSVYSPISATPCATELYLYVWAPWRCHPRPTYTRPSPPIRKLYPMSSQPRRNKFLANPGLWCQSQRGRGANILFEKFLQVNLIKMKEIGPNCWAFHSAQHRRQNSEAIFIGRFGIISLKSAT